MGTTVAKPPPIKLHPPPRPNLTYQASSPDEIALVKFAEDCGLFLLERDEKIIKI
jgi:magnesium-transporting ATPase (P-type)